MLLLSIKKLQQLLLILTQELELIQQMQQQKMKKSLKKQKLKEIIKI